MPGADFLTRTRQKAKAASINVEIHGEMANASGGSGGRGKQNFFFAASGIRFGLRISRIDFKSEISTFSLFAFVWELSNVLTKHKT